MHVNINFSVLCMLCIGQYQTKSIRYDYYKERENLIKKDLDYQVGSDLEFNEGEDIVNSILMRWKGQELEYALDNPEHYNFSKHYFSYKNVIEKSKVYQIIRQMPKGAALHVHSSLMLTVESLIELTYEDDLYACYDDDDLILQFSADTPQRPCPVKWTLLNELRNNSSDINSFDERLKKHFTLYTQNENDITYELNEVWSRFEKISRTIKQLITYRPVREKFFYEALREFYNDNIMYVEIRSGLHRLYELNGTVHDRLFMPRLYQEVTKRFIKAHPDFVGIKLIVTKHRLRTVDQVAETLSIVKQIKHELPNLFAGFDLVGQEDLGKPLVELYPALSEAQNELEYYFHSGETNWYGTSSDENLFDAVLLQSKRIGHAFALIKHPSLIMAVKQKDIALEVNVISNNVLGLVRDVRHHPLATYLALGLPVVLSSDDPGAWGADPLSHDFYVAFMGVASRHADLRLLKQLALNSIKYSALDNETKSILFKVFYSKWDIFIKRVIATGPFP